LNIYVCTFAASRKKKSTNRFDAKRKGAIGSGEEGGEGATYHVVGGDEGVVDGDELDIVPLERDPSDQPTDPSETWNKVKK